MFVVFSCVFSERTDTHTAEFASQAPSQSPSLTPILQYITNTTIYPSNPKHRGSRLLCQACPPQGSVRGSYSEMKVLLLFRGMLRTRTSFLNTTFACLKCSDRQEHATSSDWLFEKVHEAGLPSACAFAGIANTTLVSQGTCHVFSLGTSGNFFVSYTWF